MRAAIYEQFGPPEVVHIRGVARPAPRPREVLVKIEATSLTIGDTIMRSLNLPGPAWQRLMGRLFLGLRKPRRPILGMELAGRVEATGPAVTGFRPGDEVFASTFENNFGGHAEYKCLPETGVLARKPANLSCGEAAAGFATGGLTALSHLRRARVRPGQQVLIYGASGSVGGYAVQLARHFGAQVSGVCSAANLELVQGLGAGTVIDYTREDFTRRGERYDLVFDAVGKLAPEQARRAVREGGVYLNVLNTEIAFIPHAAQGTSRH